MTAFTGTRKTDGIAGFGEAAEREEKLFGVVGLVSVHLLMCGPCLWSAPGPGRLFIDGDRVDAPAVKHHLLLDVGLEAEYKIQVLPYKSILSELRTLCSDLSPREKVWLSDKASYAVSDAIPKVSGLVQALLNMVAPLWF